MVQVSDGKDVCAPRMLKVKSEQLKLTLVSNTGLALMAGSVVDLTQHNISYSTNTPDQQIEIRLVGQGQQIEVRSVGQGQVNGSRSGQWGKVSR